VRFAVVIEKGNGSFGAYVTALSVCPSTWLRARPWSCLRRQPGGRERPVVCRRIDREGPDGIDAQLTTFVVQKCVALDATTSSVHNQGEPTGAPCEEAGREIQSSSP
jgi:hypothetical protein